MDCIYMETNVDLCLHKLYIDGLVQGCSNSSDDALELQQSCTKSYNIVQELECWRNEVEMHHAN